MNRDQRRRWFVHEEFQESFSRRLLVYWCGTWLAIFAVPICARLIATELPFTLLATELISDMWFPMVMSLMVLPIVFWDSIRFSHRICGPLRRLSNDMQRLSDGDPVGPIKFRQNDFCHELAEKFNQLLRQRTETSSKKELESSSV